MLWITVQFKLCSICQRYNLKAIHNNLLAVCPEMMVVLNMSKILPIAVGTERNSQFDVEKWV